MTKEQVLRLNELLDMDWTEEDLDGMENMDDWYFVHILSTFIFDSYGHGEENMTTCLRTIEDNFPDYYKIAMERFLLGRHDT